MSQVAKPTRRQLKLKKRYIILIGMETNSSNVDSLLGTNCMVTGNVGETAGGDPNVAETGGVNSKAATDNNSIKSKNEKPKKANSGNQSTRANEAKSSR